jgi:hypothetical protein
MNKLSLVALLALAYLPAASAEMKDRNAVVGNMPKEIPAKLREALDNDGNATLKSLGGEDCTFSLSASRAETEISMQIGSSERRKVAFRGGSSESYAVRSDKSSGFVGLLFQNGDSYVHFHVSGKKPNEQVLVKFWAGSQSSHHGRMVDCYLE